MRTAHHAGAETAGRDDGEERSRLLAALGHDIKAPLHVLGLSLQNLMLRTDAAEDKEFLFAADAAFAEVAALIDDLIDTLSFGVGAMAPREEGITMSNLLQELERRFRRRAAQEGVELRFVATRVHCVSDRHYLKRVLSNLIENGLKHAQASRLVVGVRLRGFEELILEVADNGRGISGDDLPHIFEEWFRGRAAVAEGTRGQGLGLWAVRRYAEALGGRVAVQSVVDKGTRFSVTLPTYAERRMPLVAVPAREPALLGSKVIGSKVIAVLDDQEDALRAIRMSFEALGAKVYAASDDLQFLARVTSMDPPPDLFVLDFNLGATTVERALQILQTRFGPALRAIIMTGHPNDPRLAVWSQSIPVVAKPLASEHLRKIIGVLSGTESFRRELFS